MTLNEIRTLLNDRGIILTKSLGQNFLHDQNQLKRIARAGGLHKGDKVLEIGPGLGPLTEELLAQAGSVLAIEKDERLVKVLQERFAEQIKSGALILLHADALEIAKEQERNWTDWKLVANLPYSVASPILVELAISPFSPERLVATLQTEVARRLVALPDTDDYGLLTLLVQQRYAPSGTFKIPSTCFFPEPDVESSCVSMIRRPPLMNWDETRTFVRIVKRGFSQRRKMLMKLLRSEWPEPLLQSAFEAGGILSTTRAEALSLKQFVQIARHLQGKGKSGGLAAPASASTSPEEIFDVVNEKDEVIDQQTRSEVHRLGLLHRAVHILVINSKGEVFLQKRSMSKDRHPGAWDSSASGHVDSGEAYDHCAVRELKEELGIVPESAPELILKIPASAATDQEHVRVYRLRHEGPFELHPQEIERGEWFAPGKITRWVEQKPQDFATAFITIWTMVRDKVYEKP